MLALQPFLYLPIPLATASSTPFPLSYFQPLHVVHGQSVWPFCIWPLAIAVHILLCCEGDLLKKKNSDEFPLLIERGYALVTANEGWWKLNIYTGSVLWERHCYTIYSRLEKLPCQRHTANKRRADVCLVPSTWLQSKALACLHFLTPTDLHWYYIGILLPLLDGACSLLISHPYPSFKIEIWAHLHFFSFSWNSPPTKDSLIMCLHSHSISYIPLLSNFQILSVIWLLIHLNH